MKQTTKKSRPQQTEIGRELRSFQKDLSESSKKMRAFVSERQQKHMVRISVVVGSVILLLTVSPLIINAITWNVKSIKKLKQVWNV